MSTSCALRFLPRNLALALAFTVAVFPSATTADEKWLADADGCKILIPISLVSETFRWSGSCTDGYAQGDGHLQWFAKKKPIGVFTGRANGGRLENDGLMEYADGDRYQGGLVDGRFEGHGIYTFAGGSRFEGIFTAGVSSGSGRLQLADGRSLETDFVTDRTGAFPASAASPQVQFFCFQIMKDHAFGLFSRQPDDAACSGQTWSMTWSWRVYPARPTLLVLCLTSGGQFKSVDLVRSSGHQLYDDQALRMVRIRALGSQHGIGSIDHGCQMVGVAFARDEADYFFLQH